MIEVEVNHQRHSLEDGTTLESLVDKMLPHGTVGIAVAVNDVVVPRSQWATTRLMHNDKVLLIRATRGG